MLDAKIDNKQNNRGGSAVQRIKLTDPKQNEHYSKRN